MLNNCCAFTGHRPHKFPWRYDETDSRCVALKAVLTEQITALTETGITDFFSGCADGVDCWAALIVLELREKNPALKLHCILPYKGQADKCVSANLKLSVFAERECPFSPDSIQVYTALTTISLVGLKPVKP